MTAKQLQQLLQFLRYPTDLILLIEFDSSHTHSFGSLKIGLIALLAAFWVSKTTHVCIDEVRASVKIERVLRFHLAAQLLHCIKGQEL